MKFLLDTQMLIWATFWSGKLPDQARQLIIDRDNDIFFSPASLWETTIKNSRNRPDFKVEARILRGRLLDCGYQEMPITGIHAIAVSDLPFLHKDPFDRLLLAQAKTEGLSLLTTDATLAAYPAPVILFRKSG
jgi:PIN domain nuclease of toxin-antitoxin system